LRLNGGAASADGVLTRTEIGNPKQTLPASLANKDRVTRTEFMAVCSKNVVGATLARPAASWRVMPYGAVGVASALLSMRTNARSRRVSLCSSLS
jgi:hypothetical protein